MTTTQKVILGIGAVVIVAGAAFLFLGNSPAPAGQTTTATTTTATTTSAGKTYTNSTYHFSFSYPTGWHITLRGSNPEFVCFDPGATSSRNNCTTGIIDIYPDGDFNKLYSGYRNLFNNTSYQVADSTLSVGGESGKLISITNPTNVPVDTRSVFFSHAGNVYQLSTLSGHEVDFNLVAGSFTFSK